MTPCAAATARTRSSAGRVTTSSTATSASTRLPGRRQRPLPVGPGRWHRHRRRRGRRPTPSTSTAPTPARRSTLLANGGRGALTATSPHHDGLRQPRATSPYEPCGSTDTITVHDLRGPGVTDVDPCSRRPRRRRRAADAVIVNGNNRPGAVQITRSGAEVLMAGLSTRLRILGSEAPADQLRGQHVRRRRQHRDRAGSAPAHRADRRPRPRGALTRRGGRHAPPAPAVRRGYEVASSSARGTSAGRSWRRCSTTTS